MSWVQTDANQVGPYPFVSPEPHCELVREDCLQTHFGYTDFSSLVCNGFSPTHSLPLDLA